MKRVVIRCPHCRGPMWEEELPETPSLIDIVCIICGLRKFYPKSRYKKWRKEMEKKIGTSNTTARGVLPAL